VPRCGSGREALLFPLYERLFSLGELNGRKLPRFSAGAAWLVPRCGSGREALLFPLYERLF
jgi:hypothetical protein